MPNWVKIVNRTEPLQGWCFQGNNRYTVAKLKDGKCWMTQNLRIIDKTVTSEDTNMKEGSYTIPASSNSFYYSNYEVASAYYDSVHGGYYSGNVATAGGNSSLTSTYTSSICPKGWHMPTVEDLNILNLKYSTSPLSSSPSNFSLSGYGDQGIINNKETGGYYWTSSSTNNNDVSSNYIYALQTFSSYNDITSFSKGDGLAIRCTNGKFPRRNYSITYHLNGGDESSFQAETGQAVDTARIKGSTPTKDNHGFIGWCDQETVNQTCQGNAYDPNGLIKLEEAENSIELWAMWVEASSSFPCSSLSIGDVAAWNHSDKIDIVTRLKDNKCWYRNSVRQYDFNSAPSGCPTGRIPTKSEVDNLSQYYKCDIGGERIPYALASPGWGWTSTQDRTNFYNLSTSICDPATYSNKNQNMLYAGGWALDPYYVYKGYSFTLLCAY